MKTLLARLVWGRRARRALEAAQADLATTALDVLVARAPPVAPASRALGRLRGFARALGARLAATGETRPCLPRAVALFREARRHGVDPTLVVGVARTDGSGGTDPGVVGLRAHAWLELDGAPFLEAPATPASYRVVARLPVRGPRVP